jgi:hypothetical protein
MANSSTRTSKKTTAKAAAKKKVVAKKTASKKATARKTSAKKAATKKTTSAKTVAKKQASSKRPVAPNKPRSQPEIRQIRSAERHQLIAEAAYLRGESQAFLSDQGDDWLRAEAEIDTRLAKAGIKVID